MIVRDYLWEVLKYLHEIKEKSCSQQFKKQMPVGYSSTGKFLAFHRRWRNSPFYTSVLDCPYTV